MDIKIAENFMSNIISKASSYGFSDCQVRFDEEESMTVQILMGEVSSYERSSNVGVTFKGKKDGQMATASTSEFSDDALVFLLENAASNCSILDDEDEDFIYCDPDNKVLHYSQKSEAYSKNTYSKFSELGLELEKDIFAIDEAIKSVDYLQLNSSSSRTMILNSLGLNLFTDEDNCSLFAEVRAVKDGVTKTGGNLWYGNDIDNFDKDKFLSKLKNDVMGKFGASAVPSNKYNIILSNEAFISLFASFASNFNAYSMQKGISLLNGKAGTKIASDCVTIKEIPMYEKALSKAPFDTEGVLTTEKNLINNGVFEASLYNLKSANKDNVKSTGNGFSGGTRISNLVVVPGELDFDGLCKKLGNGLYITELNGLHAGVNAISGDFSLFCGGYLIENGEIVRSVEQITISDNFYDLLKKISDVGNDVYSYPMGVGEYFFPSIIINDVAIAGDAEE